MNIWLKWTALGCSAFIGIWFFFPSSIGLWIVFWAAGFFILAIAKIGVAATPAINRSLDAAASSYEAQVARAKAFDAKGHPGWLR